jgi:DUF1680 family protein
MTWDSTVHVRVASGPGGSWELALRIPEWAETALSVNGIRVAFNTCRRLVGRRP